MLLSGAGELSAGTPYAADRSKFITGRVGYFHAGQADWNINLVADFGAELKLVTFLSEQRAPVPISWSNGPAEGVGSGR